MDFNYIKMKMVKISVYRWLLSFFLVVLFSNAFMSVYMNYCESSKLTPYFFEYMVSFLNNEIFIGYILFFVIILLASDIFNPMQNAFEECILLKFSNRIRWYKANVLFALSTSILIVITILLINILLSMLQGLRFHNSIEIQFSLANTLGDNRMPQSAVLVSSVLIMLRLFSMIQLVYLINLNSRFAFGILSVFVVTLVDNFFYSMFNITKPLFILPIEHTRTLYTPGAYGQSFGGIRPDYFISFAYWISILISLFCITYSVVRKKEFHTLYKF